MWSCGGPRPALERSSRDSARHGLGGPRIPYAGLQGFLMVSALRHPWRPRSAASAARSRIKSGPDGIAPADGGERIERCPQARKSAPVPVHF